MVEVLIPSPLRTYTDNQKSVSVTASTVIESVQELVAKYPALKQHLFTEENSVRSFINIYINNTNCKDLQGFDTPLEDGEEVVIIPAVAGGRL